MDREHMSDQPAESDERLRDSKHSSQLLHGPLGWQIFWLALPVLAEQFLNYTVGLTDVRLSGFISKEATSAVGVGAYVNWLVEILFAVVGTGTSALVARHWGAGERDEASRIARSSLSVAMILGLVSAVLMYVIAPSFTVLLGLNQDLVDIAIRYLRVCSFGYVFSSVCLIGSAALRGAGMMRVPMFVLGIVSLLNVVFSTSLVFGVPALRVPAIGLDGVATGTVLARAMGAGLMLMALGWKKSDLHALPSINALLDVRTMLRVLKIGAPAATDGVLYWLGHVLFVRLIAGIGSGEQANAALAAHTVFVQVEAITYMPAWAWGTAAATLIGQCLGAKLPDRARQGAHRAAMQAASWAAVTTLLFLFGSPWIFEQMHNDPLVGQLGAPALQALCWMEIPLTAAIIYTISVRGAGDTIAPLFINTVCVFGVRLTVGYAGIHWWHAGLYGAWLGMACDVTLRAVVIGCYFRSGRWMKKSV